MNIRCDKYGVRYGKHSTVWAMLDELTDNGDGTYNVNDQNIADMMPQGSEIIVINKPGLLLFWDPGTQKAYDWSATGGGGGGGDQMKFLIVEQIEGGTTIRLNKTAREIFAAAPFVYLHTVHDTGSDNIGETYECFGENPGDVFSGVYIEGEGVRLPTESSGIFTCASLDDYPATEMPE